MLLQAFPFTYRDTRATEESMASTSTLTRVMVHDPNPLLASAICSGLELDGSCIAQVCSGDLRDSLTAFRPNILVLDPVHLPPVELKAWRAELGQWFPGCEVLAYLDANSQNAAAQCLAAGFVGVVSQQKGIEALVQAVTVARLGGLYVDPRFAPAVSTSVAPEPVGQGQLSTALSERERYVLEHVARGFSNKEIARRISVSPKTVETHRARARAKLGLCHTSDIVQHALRNNWLAGEALAA
jgi:DNA-binding NarL/FixJ family response regulator